MHDEYPEANELHCPKCGSTKAMVIVYGIPSAELLESTKRGVTFVLAGCLLTPATHECANCRTWWIHRPEGD